MFSARRWMPNPSAGIGEIAWQDTRPADALARNQCIGVLA
jgi:hypothetical protein